MGLIDLGAVRRPADIIPGVVVKGKLGGVIVMMRINSVTIRIVVPDLQICRISLGLYIFDLHVNIGLGHGEGEHAAVGQGDQAVLIHAGLQAGIDIDPRLHPSFIAEVVDPHLGGVVGVGAHPDDHGLIRLRQTGRASLPSQRGFTFFSERKISGTKSAFSNLTTTSTFCLGWGIFGMTKR